MIIAYEQLKAHLKAHQNSFYLLFGTEPYLMTQASLALKAFWQDLGPYETQIMELDTVENWSNLSAKANQLALFSPRILLDARFNKKKLDALGKRICENYAHHINPNACIIIRAPFLQAKDLIWMKDLKNFIAVQLKSFSDAEFNRWIVKELNERLINFDAQVPKLIFEYTQGNLLAAAQVIEQISLTPLENKTLHITDLEKHLIDQTEFSLYQLSDACLSGKSATAIHCFRQIKQSSNDLNLILWILSQDLRLLLELKSLTSNLSPSEACKRKSIWPSKTSLYLNALKRLSINQLELLLQTCHHLDCSLKSAQIKSIDTFFEAFILSFSGNS